MKVLIACERNGKTRDAFIALGHDAISCDLVPSVNGGPHYQGDVMDIINDGWDLMIAHPDCTYLCSSGLHWNKRTPGRQEKTDAALEFVRKLMASNISKVVIENPVGCISTQINALDYGFNKAKATQYIQPYNFGHDASKKTGLWIKGLPPLKADPNNYIEPRIVEYPVGSGKMVERWGNQTDSGQNKLGPSEARAMERAETYQGWADAFAAQWGIV